jgi:LysR family transcriptional activator of nhaA
VPEVVQQDELSSGKLKKYFVLENVAKRFYVITAKRHFELLALKNLLEKSQESVAAVNQPGLA